MLEAMQEAEQERLLPSLQQHNSDFQQRLEIEKATNEMAVAQENAKNLALIGHSLSVLASFITSGRLERLLSLQAQVGCASSIAAGITQHGGRLGLDARTIKQNALEITEFTQSIFSKLGERLSEKPRDPELHDSENDYKTYLASVVDEPKVVE